MPVWGEEVWKYPKGEGLSSQVTSRIAVLVAYLQSIQEIERVCGELLISQKMSNSPHTPWIRLCFDLSGSLRSLDSFLGLRAAYAVDFILRRYSRM